MMFRRITVRRYSILCARISNYNRNITYIYSHSFIHSFKKYPNKLYYRIQISDQKNIQNFFHYLNKTHFPFLKKVKELFPWNLNGSLKKKDFLTRRT